MRSKSIITTVTILVVFLMSCSTKEVKLQKLIGQPITSQPIQNYLNEIDVEPEISKYDDNYFYIFRSKGIDFSFSTSDTLKAIFLFSESADNHRQFQEQIPYGITFNDTRKVVEEKLGPPDNLGGGGVISFYSNWDKKGILITYKSIDQEDMMNRIHHIALTKKEN